MATNIRVSAVFNHEVRPIQWTLDARGCVGDAAKLLKTCKAKFKCKGQLSLEANGAPCEDDTKLVNGAAVRLRKGPVMVSPKSVLADLAPVAALPPLSLEARSVGGGGAAAAAVCASDDLMDRIARYARGRWAISMPCASRRFRVRCALPTHRCRYFLETEEDSLRRFSKHRAASRKGGAAGKPTTTWNPMSRVTSDLIDAQLEAWVRRSIEAPRDAPGSALLVTGWDRRSAALHAAFQDLARRAAEGRDAAGAPDAAAGPLRRFSRALTTSLYRGGCGPEQTEIDFQMWSAVSTRQVGSVLSYHTTRRERSVARLRCLDGAGAVVWRRDPLRPTVAEVMHAFAHAQAGRRVSHKRLDDVRWSADFGSAHVVVHSLASG